MRIEQIEVCRVNWILKKVFNAYKFVKGSYVFCGQFSAPVRTANRDLHKFVV